MKPVSVMRPENVPLFTEEELRGVACPKCKRAVGRPCYNLINGNERQTVHLARRAAMTNRWREQQKAKGKNMTVILDGRLLTTEPAVPMKATPAKTYFFASSNGKGTYQTILWSNGTLTCDCPGWCKRVASDGSRTCKHTRFVLAGLGTENAVKVIDHNAKTTVTISTSSEGEVEAPSSNSRAFKFD